MGKLKFLINVQKRKQAFSGKNGNFGKWAPQIDELKLALLFRREYVQNFVSLHPASKNTYPKNEKLKSKTTIDLLFSEGKSVSKYPLRLVYVPLDPEKETTINRSLGFKKIFQKSRRPELF